jgi:hypothetical protein
MTSAEKKRLSTALPCFQEREIQSRGGVNNWQKLLEHLLADEEMLGGVRLTFRDLYLEIEKSSDPSAALEASLGRIPARKTTQ